MVNIFLEIILEKIFSWYFLAKINGTKHFVAFFLYKTLSCQKLPRKVTPTESFI